MFARSPTRAHVKIVIDSPAPVEDPRPREFVEEDDIAARRVEGSGFGNGCGEAGLPRRPSINAANRHDMAAAGELDAGAPVRWRARSVGVSLGDPGGAAWSDGPVGLSVRLTARSVLDAHQPRAEGEDDVADAGSPGREGGLVSPSELLEPLERLDPLPLRPAGDPWIELRSAARRGRDGRTASGRRRGVRRGRSALRHRGPPRRGPRLRAVSRSSARRTRRRIRVRWPFELKSCDLDRAGRPRGGRGDRESSLGRDVMNGDAR